MPPEPTFGRRKQNLSPTPEKPEPSERQRLTAPTPKGAPIKDILFSLDGRVSRRSYWLGNLGAIVAYGATAAMAKPLDALAKIAGATPTGAGQLMILVVALLGLLVAMALAFWASFTVTVRRWYDRGRSWTWALLGFVPIVGWVWQGVECGFLQGALGPNRFGRSPKRFVGVNYERVIVQPSH